MLRFFLYTVGFILSGTAAYYSVTGLAYVFSGAFWPIIVMGGTLEAAKLVGASWVFRSWRTAPRVLTTYISLGIVLLMLLTGMGIFGFLSRAYLIQQAPVSAMSSELAAAERTVALAQEQYDRDVAALRASQGNQSSVVERLAANNRLTGTNGAVTVLRQQQQLQQTLQRSVTTAATALRDAETARATLQRSFTEQTVDVGPLMFVAKAWYGNTELDTIDRTVRWLIILIMSAFDPMAIALLLAAQHRSTAETPRRIVEPTPQEAPPTAPPTAPTMTPPVITPPRAPHSDPFDRPTAAEFSSVNVEPATEIDITDVAEPLTTPADTIPASRVTRWKIGRRRNRIAPKQ
jgi:hypothetical protein